MRKNRRLIAIVAGLVLMMSSMSALAAGTSSVSVSSNSPGVGDTFTVTATATESGKMAVKYNKDVLSVVNCDVSGYTSSPGEVDFNGKRGTITFKANAAGESAISVSSDSASGSSMVVNVGGAAAGVASEDFDINGVKYTVSERFSNEEIPGGYSPVQLTINGKNLKGVSNGAMTLVYLKPVDNVAGAGTFYIYDQASNSVKDYVYLGRADYYVIPSSPTEIISDKLTQGTIDVDGRQVSIFKVEGEGDFVYVYGTSSTNVTGWFQYDIAEKTVQRVNKAVFASGNTSAEPENTSSILDKIKAINIRYIIAGAIFVLIIVIAVVINIILKKRDDKADLIDGDEEDFVDSIDKKSAKEEKKRAKEEKKAAKKEARRRKKEEYYDDEDDEVDDIYDEYDDFDIDQSIDNLKAEEEPKGKDDTPEIKPEAKQDTNPESKPDTEPEAKSDVKEDAPKSKEDEEDFAFWEDEKDIKKEQKRRKKEQKKAKNVFGDDELDLNEEYQKKMKKKSEANSSSKKSGGSDIIDFNDL